METFVLISVAIIAIAIVAVRIQQGCSESKDPSDLGLDTLRSEKDQVDSSSVVVLSSLLPPEFIVLDLETTGLDPLRDEIIEFGAIHVVLDREFSPTFQALVKPKRMLPQKITEMTGITQGMLDNDGMGLREALTQFAEFVEELPIVTYNAEFDMGFIWNAAKKCRVKFDNKYACALKRCRRAWPNLPSHRLAYVAEIMSLPDGNTHRALADCERAMRVFMCATRELNQKVRWSKPPIDWSVPAQNVPDSGRSQESKLTSPAV